MPAEISANKLSLASVLVAAAAITTHNPQRQWTGNHYFVEAVDAPVSPSSSPKENIVLDSSPDKMRQQRQKTRPSNKRHSQQKQQQHHVAENEHLTRKEQQQHQMKHVPKSEYDAYMHWCEAVLGIRSVVEIKEIEYVDHLRILWEDNEKQFTSHSSIYHTNDATSFEWLQQYLVSGSVGDGHHKDDSNNANMSKQSNDLPIKLVRGLAAKHDISVGDIVISIPLYSLLSVPTTIDHDPVLSRILGPKARERYGWTDTLEYEVPLLVIAVLYHRSLGMESPLSHYIDVLLQTPTDLFPFLWSHQELRDNADRIGDEVKKLARVIQQDLYEMYDGIMGKLVTEHPDLFAPPNNDESVEGWIYSYGNFRWAFALVVSRHHYLPIQDLDYGTQSNSSASNKKSNKPHINVETTSSDSTVSEVVPPANQPTDSWVELAKNEERVLEDETFEDQNKVVTTESADDDDIIVPSGFFKHSFLAPLADMINFGPPCLTGAYNPDDHVFELIATCPFKAGQEVTFYYSSECADVIIANYGFLHPLVPPCPTFDEIQKKVDDWKNQAIDAGNELWKAYRQVDILKGEIMALESQLLSCENGENGVADRRQEYSMLTSNERMKIVWSKQSIESETPSHQQKLRKEGHPSSWRNHEVGVRGRMNEASHQEFDEQIMEELG